MAKTPDYPVVTTTVPGNPYEHVYQPAPVFEGHNHIVGSIAVHKPAVPHIMTVPNISTEIPAIAKGQSLLKASSDNGLD